MEKDLKDLLLKDLCARLSYGVKLLHTPTNEITNLEMIGNGVIDGNIHDLIENFKPYLFPLSSITEEQKRECFKGTPLEIDKYGNIAARDDFYGNSQYTDLEIYLEVIEWLNRNHFDYRGLIEKELALDANNLNIY